MGLCHKPCLSSEACQGQAGPVTCRPDLRLHLEVLVDPGNGGDYEGEPRAVVRRTSTRSPSEGGTKQKAEESAETEKVQERNQTVWEEPAASVTFSSANGAEEARRGNALWETREGADGLGQGPTSRQRRWERAGRVSQRRVCDVRARGRGSWWRQAMVGGGCPGGRHGLVSPLAPASLHCGHFMPGDAPGSKTQTCRSGRMDEILLRAR